MSVTPPALNQEGALQLLGAHWALAGSLVLSPLPSYDDINFRVDHEPSGQRYVFKVLHAEASEGVVQLQHECMGALRRAGVAAPFPVPCAGSGAGWVRVQCGPHGHYARLLEWVHGRDYADVPPPQRGLYAPMYGELVARVDLALATLQPPPPAAFRQWVWRTSDAHLVAPQRDVVARRQSADRLRLWDETMRLWTSQWAAEASALPQGLVHNDINDHNVLVSGEGEAARVQGILDLGDACVEVYALALGNSLFYAMLGLPLDSVQGVARAVVQGYRAVRPLSPSELRLAAVGARVRCLVSATMAGLSAEQHPDNEYAGETERPGWVLLEHLCTLGLDYLL